MISLVFDGYPHNLIIVGVKTLLHVLECKNNLLSLVLIVAQQFNIVHTINLGLNVFVQLIKVFLDFSQDVRLN